MKRFFLGKNFNTQVIPEESKSDAEVHFAWCLSTAIDALEASNSDTDKIKALNAFYEDVLRSPATSSMGEDIKKFIAPMIVSKQPPKTEILISYLMGIPVNEKYFTCERSINKNP